jgi:hypothetical protein
MPSAKKLRQESHSGPELYLSVNDDIITLGSLAWLLGEIFDAMRGAQLAVAELAKYRHGHDSEPTHILMASLALEYAIQCHDELIPSASIDGKDFRYDINGDTGKRITFTDLRRKAEQKRRYDEASEAARKEQEELS